MSRGWDCLCCIHVYHDPDYRISVGEEDIDIEMFLCDNRELKDMYYNGVGDKRVPKNREVNPDNQPAIPIGNVCWACGGSYFKKDEEKTLYDVL